MLLAAVEDDLSAYSISKELTGAANRARLIGMLIQVQEDELQLA